MSRPEQVLVVGPSWVGDMVMAQTLFKLLHNQGEVQIDVVAPAWSEAILGRMPEVRRTHILNVGHGQLALGARYRLGTALRSTGYDRAIVLPRSYKSALVPWFAGSPVRTGFRGEFRFGLLNDVRELDKEQLDQTVKRFAALGLPPGAELSNLPQPHLLSDAGNQQRLQRELDLTTDGSAVALMPGAAYGPAKMWPVAHFARLAAQLTAAGHQVWVLGAAGERELGDKIAAKAGREARNLCGSTRLEDTVDLISLAAVAVANDSGLMHVAAATGTHVIAIYGSTPPEFAPPLTHNKTVHYLRLECSPCRQRECPLGHLDCLNRIEPEDVFASVVSATG